MRNAPCGTVTSLPSTVSVISACRTDEETNVRRPAERSAHSGRSTPKPAETYDAKVVPGRVDDGVAATLASTPADEGREADDTSRSMALRRRERAGIVSGEGARRRSAHDEERVQDDALVAQLDDQTPAFAE